MNSFIPRKLVNGALLRTSSGQNVALHVYVENAERFAKKIEGKTTDDMDVRLELDEPLNVSVNGWIQAFGIPKGLNAVQTKEVI